MNNLKMIITPRETALIRKIANKIYREYGMHERADIMTREDLYHYGIIGLLEAKKRFDPEHPAPFLAFAALRIRGAMLDQLRVLPVVRHPQEVMKKIKELKNTEEELDRTEQEIAPDILAKRLGWSLEELWRIKSLHVKMVPIADKPGSDENFPREYGETLEGKMQDPEEISRRKEIAGLIDKCIEALSTVKDRLIIKGRYLEELTLKEIAKALDCSEQNIHQRQKKSEKQLKSCMERHGWTSIRCFQI